MLAFTAPHLFAATTRSSNLQPRFEPKQRLERVWFWFSVFFAVLLVNGTPETLHIRAINVLVVAENGHLGPSGVSLAFRWNNTKPTGLDR